VHPLLGQQLRRLTLDPGAPPGPEQWSELLARVSRAYADHDRSRYLVERSLEISSVEMAELYDALRGASATEAATQHRRLEIMIRSLGDGLCALDAHGRIVEVNPEAERLLVGPGSPLVGRRLGEVVRIRRPDSSRRRSGYSLAQAMAAGRAWRSEHALFVRADGVTFPASCVLNPIRGEAGLQGAVLVFRDISDRRRAEEELRRQRDYSAALLAALQDGLTLIAPDGTLTEVNERFCAMTGFGREELVGTTPPYPYWPEADPVRIQASFARIREAGGREFELVFTRRDGERFPALVTSAPLRGDEGQVTGFVGTVKDISERKRVEAELAALAATDHLTGLANHRTFQDRLTAEVSRALRYGRSLSLVVFDLDYFKQVNDRYGHQVGDVVLKEVARRLDGQARSSDLVARVGGEEFAWILPECGGLDAWTAAEHAREVVGGSPIEPVGRVTVSGGVCDLVEGRDASDLCRLADGALYWAKAHGRDVIFRYSPEVVEVLSAQERADRLERFQSLSAIRVLARGIDSRDPSTRQHSERVAELAVGLATELGWPPERAGQLREAGLVHDVGKIGVPDRVLFNPGRLSPAEFERIKEHAATGAEMLRGLFSDEQVAWVRHHHERYDGEGYPDRLAGESIEDGARILAVAEVWDAMVTAHSYSAPRSPADALAECRAQAGRQFCPRVVAALERLVAADALPVAEHDGGPAATA
jgi:diguanylate cyclase (GGDEF)-like protein/PAS domain S-box-containing protein/putative nucleotidyltransferase with HDIG domain